MSEKREMVCPSCGSKEKRIRHPKCEKCGELLKFNYGMGGWICNNCFDWGD
jgi:ribosomal protein L37AE/L43A